MEMIRMARFKTNIEQLMREKGAREHRKITQEIVAREAKVSLPLVSRWVRGNIARIELRSAMKLCRYFDCTFEELVEFDPENEYDTPSPDED